MDCVVWLVMLTLMPDCGLHFSKAEEKKAWAGNRMALSLFVVISWRCCRFGNLAWFLLWFLSYVAEHISYLWHFFGNFGHNTNILTSLYWLIGQILKVIDACLVFSYRILQSAELLGFWTVSDNCCSKSWISIGGVKTNAVANHFSFCYWFWIIRRSQTVAFLFCPWLPVLQIERLSVGFTYKKKKENLPRAKFSLCEA